MQTNTDSTLVPYTANARRTWERGMRTAQSKVWHAAMAARLRFAAHVYSVTGEGDMGRAIACLDRAVESEYLAR